MSIDDSPDALPGELPGDGPPGPPANVALSKSLSKSPSKSLSKSLSKSSPCELAGGEVAGYELVDFAGIPGVPCPCGTARRAFADVADYPGTIHVTEIAEDARLHYHRRLTETYYFLECEPDAAMQLDDSTIPVHPGMCILIRPGTRHRAIGKMKVLIVVFPKFDPSDEWFDERGHT